ncbi:MAG: transglycosylase SLT domain-containing protein [Solidesulfovibrio sp.]
MHVPEISFFSDRFGAVLVGLALALCCALSQAAPAAAATPWEPPRKPDDIPLPRSARLGASGAETAKSLARNARQAVSRATPAIREVALGVTEVLAGRHLEGAKRLADVAVRAGDLADVVAYYQGLGLYLAGDAGGASKALADLAARPVSSFLGRDALYLAMESAARQNNHESTLALAEAWLADADPTLAPQVWLRAAVAASALGQTRKAQDFLRHLSLTWPASKAAAAGDALAREVCGRNKSASGGQGAALDLPGGVTPPGPPERGEDKGEGNAGAGKPGAGVCYDPDAPGNVLQRAEAMVEKGSPQGALDLLEGKGGFDVGQAARADYIRGKALYRLRRPQASAAAFVRAATAAPDATLANWARYHEARCLWRSLEADDAQRMEALLRQVLAAPGRDDPLREVTARHLALLLAERGRLAEALVAAGELRGLAVTPELAAQGASLAAILRFATGDMTGAEAELAAFVTRFPDDDWADGARYWRGKALADLKRPDEAAAVWIEVLSRRPNTYYGGKSAAALTALGPTRQTVVASPVQNAPRCLTSTEPPSPTAQAAQAKARELTDAGLPALGEMLLDFSAKAAPDRADLAMAHMQAAASLGRRWAILKTAWRTFGGCLLRGTPEDLAPLRQVLFPRAYTAQVHAALAGSSIDPDMIYSLIRQESFFDPAAVSGAGAIGLMQLMPETAKAVGRKLGIKNVERAELFDPAVNIRLGVEFFRERVSRAGNLPAALAGYNAGENRVAIWSRSLSPLGEELFIELIPYTETRDYVRRIIANAMMYDRLYPR